MTSHDLKWPWGYGEGSLVAISRLRVSSLPVNRYLRVFRMVFFKKRHLSLFSHWLIIERSQNWPDLGSLISKLRDTHFIGAGIDINFSKFQGDRAFGVARTSIQTFSEVRSRPDLERPRSETFTCAEKMYEQVCQKRWRGAPLFFYISAKNLKGGVQTPPLPQARRGLTVFRIYRKLMSWRNNRILTIFKKSKIA